MFLPHFRQFLMSWMNSKAFDRFLTILSFTEQRAEEVSPKCLARQKPATITMITNAGKTFIVNVQNSLDLLFYEICYLLRQ